MNPPEIELNPLDLLNGIAQGFHMMWQAVGPDGFSVALLIILAFLVALGATFQHLKHMI